MKGNSGVTILELVVAGAVTTVFIFFLSGVYFSALNLSMEVQAGSHADRNAQVVLMHMQKHVILAASHFKISKTADTRRVAFMTYNGYDFASGPTRKNEYVFDNNEQQLTYLLDDVPQDVFNHVGHCYFQTSVNDGTVLQVQVVALDDNGGPSGELGAYIQAGLTASPSVYTVPEVQL